MFRRQNRFSDLVHCIMSNVMTFKLENDAKFFQVQPSDIACDMQSSWFIQDTSLAMCCRYSPLESSSSKATTWANLVLSIVSEVALCAQ